ALKLRSDFVPALNELALILSYGQKPEQAEQLLAEAIRSNPGYADNYLNRGFLRQESGKLSGATADYRRAAELQTGGQAARFSSGVGYAQQKRAADAVTAFRAAVWMNPNFWQARYLLGVELAVAEKIPEAQAQFAEVVRLRPDFAKAHLNLGVALAKQRKLEE